MENYIQDLMGREFDSVFPSILERANLKEVNIPSELKKALELTFCLGFERGLNSNLKK